MNFAIDFANNFLILLDAMAIYILIGLLIAGILKQLVPDDFVIKHLGKGSTSSVLKATLFGIPLPVCSCSVIPLAQGLRKEGASKGAVQSFLISTPITGVDSILATFSFFGFVFTVFRVVSSVIIAIIVGLVQNFVEKEDDIKNFKEDSSCGCSNSSCSSTQEKKKFSLKNAFSYAYKTLFIDMVKPLFIGLLLGAIFTTFTPKEYTSLLFENQILTYIVIMIFAMPLYVCATASLPIAAAFILQGMSGGAAFIFLTAGPATSAITMSVVYKTLGRTSLIVYVSTIAILSFIFAFIYDFFFANINIINFSNNIEESTLISQIASLIMLALMSYYLIKPWVSRKTIKEEKIKKTSFVLKDDNEKKDLNKMIFKKENKFKV
ncbi:MULTISPECIES: SO_0444 family Cu/Zn efflux transporter [Arcobacteraceae]|uniref:Permease n=1 Tax=Poseidonibacter parvus TaxID=1850254 RepID=A0A1P8KMH9_9BACT|nr:MULTISPECIES: SO_0444 family Cu/Zn efflux transporter [Arcobacteraceae]APW65728.1 hypothetical protein LPB137_07620 [Poseidonibacter parvus]